MNPIKICCSGLTVYEIPEALGVADVVIVEETDFSGGMMIPPESPKPWCKVVVKDPVVACKIAESFNWTSDEKRATRFGAAAFFETDGGNGEVVAKLQEIFPEIEYEHV